MKVVILAGGFGTRLSEETKSRPKPMVEIGGKPILWHIMGLYSAHGFNDFIVALGYRSEVIKQYFLGFYAMNHNLTVDLGTGLVTLHDGVRFPWRVDLVETGLTTATGGRLKRLASYLDDTFMLTYGDGVANVDVTGLVEFHRSHGKLATITAVRPPARFGNITLSGGQVQSFAEKPQAGEGRINGGFLVMEPGALDYITGDETPLEHEPLERLSRDGQLMAFEHDGFWHPMDTLRDQQLLEELWQSGNPPWRPPEQADLAVAA